ncbi:hypothetical protein ALNOE001_03590 [Candidatus Methanobinarius endosymbioticus]|uniref:Uncharacterized protein n=1 Tax=Candidatus Methanobinarius endosymbioticus TaxID=2006182 RepID=A0A366MFL5_9EURY|nr:hypothetical protein ALNOE001_03590 [Candidatus Methanobinarius endosymbioticus]
MNNSGNNTNANLNWWGTNNAESKIINIGNNLSMNYWYVLQLSANINKIIINDTFEFHYNSTVNLSYILTTNKPIDNDPMKLPYFEVTVKESNGEYIKGDVRDTILSFLVKITGEKFIQAITDGENMILRVKNSAKPKPPEPPEPPEPSESKPDNNKNVFAGMKSTGIPLISVMIVFLGFI